MSGLMENSFSRRRLTVLALITSLITLHYIQPASGEWPMFHADLQHTGRSSFSTGPSAPALAWSYKAGHDVESSPVLGTDGSIYVGSADNMLYAFSSTGVLSWSYETADLIFSSPLIDATGTVYIGSTDGNFYALSSGALAWTYMHPGTTPGDLGILPRDRHDG